LKTKNRFFLLLLFGGAIGCDGRQNGVDIVFVPALLFDLALHAFKAVITFRFGFLPIGVVIVRFS
jgi:hypothetical protein